MKKRNNYTGFVIMHPKSGMLHFTMRSTKKGAKEELCHNYCQSWEESKAEGYFVIKVKISPIRNKK